jgi:hypothetical protein
MGLIWKAASIMTLGGMSNPARREPPAKAARGQAKAALDQAKAARDQAKAAKDQEKAAQAQAELAEAELAEAEAKLANEQATVIAKAMQEDEAHRQATWNRSPRKRPRPCRLRQPTSDAACS